MLRDILWLKIMVAYGGTFMDRDRPPEGQLPLLPFLVAVGLWLEVSPRELVMGLDMLLVQRPELHDGKLVLDFTRALTPQTRREIANMTIISEPTKRALHVYVDES